MFIAMRLPLIISAKSEMLSISLLAEEVRRPCTFYKHYVPTARFRPDSFERLLLRRNHLAGVGRKTNARGKLITSISDFHPSDSRARQKQHQRRHNQQSGN